LVRLSNLKVDEEFQLPDDERIYRVRRTGLENKHVVVADCSLGSDHILSESEMVTPLPNEL